MVWSNGDEWSCFSTFGRSAKHKQLEDESWSRTFLRSSTEDLARFLLRAENLPRVTLNTVFAASLV